MTLEELKTRCDNAGLTYKYGYVEEGQEAPYLVGVVADSNNFVADNKVYKKICNVDLFYVYKIKDTSIEELIENTILEGVVWRKGDENYLADNDVWQIIYNFRI